MAIDHKNLDENIDKFSRTYLSAKPYPNIVIDDVLHATDLKQIIADYPDVDDSFWTNYIHYNENKHGLSKWEHIPTSIQKLITEFQSVQFVNWLEKLTGIPHLFPDQNLEGAGLHQTKNGGFLNIHADFTVHPKQRNWRRRVNVLIYLNEHWNSNYGGNLELWNSNMTSCEAEIEPTANRIAIFSTGDKTFHGYPNPIKCPENMARKSIALYFYTQENSPQKTATHYQARPTDGAKKWLIWGDTLLIAIYSRLKGVLGLNDDFVSGILKRFSKKK